VIGRDPREGGQGNSVDPVFDQGEDRERARARRKVDPDRIDRGEGRDEMRPEAEDTDQDRRDFPADSR
jgi:hypothetical protein